MPYCVLPLSVLQYIAILQYVVRLIKEHIMSLKLVKKLSRNVKLYCIFLVQSSLQCNNWILTTWKTKNVAIFNSYTMGTSGLPDIYTRSPRATGPRAEGVYIRQTTSAHGITNM